MIAKEVIEEILSRADIVQIISNYINVIKKGNSYVAICPFHNDKNPSMQISRTKQIYKCFSCGAGGNVFTFVQDYEKISYLDAVRKVASLINYTSPLLEKKERIVDVETKEILKALNDTSTFYHYILSTSAGEEGKKYLLNRNITHEMIDYFSLGFAPMNGEMTIKQLRSKGNDVDVLDRAGILLHDKNSFTDRFRNRVVFPLFNEFSEVIGFSSRRINDSDEAKYVNSPASDLFNKSNVLYNYQNAKLESKKAGYCYIVEGFMDVFSLYQVGIKSCVALMGTAFTKNHAKMLKRLGVEIRLCLDGDEAGMHSMMNICPILDSELVDYRIVDYRGDTRDPDEIYNQDGKEALLALLNKLIKKNDFIISYLKNKYDLSSIDGKKEFISYLSKNVSFTNEIESEAFFQEISSLTRINMSTLKNQFNIGNIDEISLIKTNKKSSHVSKGMRIQRQLIYYLLNSKDAEKLIKSAEVNPFIDDKFILISNYIEEIRSIKSDFSINDLISLIQEMNGNKELINEIIDISESNNIYPDFTEEILNECLEAIQSVINKKRKKEVYNQASLELDELEKAKILDERKGVE